MVFGQVLDSKLKRTDSTPLLGSSSVSPQLAILASSSNMRRITLSCLYLSDIWGFSVTLFKLNAALIKAR